jgi:hypothetical protein
MFFRHSPSDAQTIARHETKRFQWRTAFLPQPFANGAQLSSRVPKLSSVQSVAHRETKPFQWRIPRFSQRWPNAHRKTAVCPMDLPATFRPVDPTRHRERKRFLSSDLRRTHSPSNGREVEFFQKFFRDRAAAETAAERRPAGAAATTDGPVTMMSRDAMAKVPILQPFDPDLDFAPPPNHQK